MTDRIGLAIARAHQLLMAIAAAVLIGALCLLAWAVLLYNPDPIVSERVAAVDPHTRYLDRGRSATFKIARELCSRRDQTVEIVRSWTEMARGDALRPVVLFTSLQYDLRAGCHTYWVEQAIPETLPPGLYVYDVGVRAMDALGRPTAPRRLQPVPVAVVGGRWDRDGRDVPLPPPLGATIGHAPLPGVVQPRGASDN